MECLFLLFFRLRDIQNEKLGEPSDNRNVAHFGIEMVFRLIGNEVPNLAPYIEMNSNIPQDSEAPTVLLFPGIEGLINIYQDMAKELNAPTIGVQLSMDSDQRTITEIAESVMPVSY